MRHLDLNGSDAKWNINNNVHKVLDVDYNGMLLIDLPTPFTDTTVVEPFMIKLV